MASPQIVEKLNQLVNRTQKWDEVNVTYLLVQTRKLLDHNRNRTSIDNFKSLRFYCDWTVHITKDRIDSSTLTVLKTFEKDMKAMIGRPNYHAEGPIAFAYFDDLRKDILTFLNVNGIDSSRIQDESDWINFVSNLVKILENQPLCISKSHGMLIKSIEFQLSAPGTVWLRAILNSPFQGPDGVSYKYFDLKNIY